MITDNRQQRSPYGQRPQQGQVTVSPGPQFGGISFHKPLDPELFNSKAQDAARAIACADNQRNKSTQLRRFYDELMLWETRTTQQPERFQEYLPFIRMLNAKAAYAEGRKLVDRTFVDLFSHTLKEVQSAETLTTCRVFWEAFLGFYKQERQD